MAEKKAPKGGKGVVGGGSTPNAGEVESRKEGGLRVWTEALVIAFLFLMFANTYVVQTFYIPSGSMEETLLVGDHLLVNRFIYGPAVTDLERSLLPGRPVRRGDILIFRSLEDPNLEAVVKRCVAVAGDTVELRNRQLLINGEAMNETGYAVHKPPEGLSPIDRRRFQRMATARLDNFGPLEVPEDHVFCMGDNRYNSHDSRAWGPLPRSHIKGRALIIYWSYDDPNGDGRLPGAGNRLGRLGSTLINLPRHSRWERTFQLIQ
jgi:signal peptidase I